MRTRDELPPAQVSLRQKEGCANNAITQAMEISVKTVEKHRRSPMAKLDVHDTAALVRLALKHGLIFIDD